MMGIVEFLASARIMRAISKAPISRMLVEQTTAVGGSYSRVVRANAGCVLDETSKPSRFKASVSRLEKYTLVSISKILAGRPARIMSGPPQNRATARAGNDRPGPE